MNDKREDLDPETKEFFDGVWFVIKFCICLLMVSAFAFYTAKAFAGTATVTWAHPTTNTDGSAIPTTGTGAIVSSRVEWGSCSGTAFGTRVGEALVSYPTATHTIPNLTPTTTYCFRVFARNSYGEESAPSVVVTRVIPAPIPNPPVVAVAVVAGMMQTPVYSVTSTNRLSTLMGFVDVGTECVGPVLFTYRGSSFREVPRATVKMWGSTTLRLAAPCA